jgi:hypothetical protein
MKKLALALCLMIIAAAGSANALQWQNNLGLYFDEGAENFCDALPVGYHVGAAHLILTNITVDSISAWEAKITSENVLIGAFTLRGDGINFASRTDEYIVGTGAPMSGDSIILADFDLYVTDDMAPAYLFIGGVYFHSLEERVPAFTDGADADNIIEARQSLGGPLDPVMLINAECNVVAVEDASWDSVKSLYR